MKYENEYAKFEDLTIESCDEVWWRVIMVTKSAIALNGTHNSSPMMEIG